MLSPVIIIGAGGSGGKTLRSLRQTLLRRLRAKGWTGDIPEAWQFLEIDTVAVQSRENFPADLLPTQDYLGLVPSGVTYKGLQQALLTRMPKSDQLAAFGGWLPESTPVAVQRGAGQYRTLGRAVAVSQLGRIADSIKKSYARMTAPGAAAQLREATQLLTGKADGNIPQPMAIIVSSVAGGSGAGIFLDVAEALKSVNPMFAESTHTFLYGPDVFNSVPKDMRDQIPANVLGSINEVIAGLWAEGPSAGTSALFNSAGLIGQSQRGFGSRFNYIIGASNGIVTFPNQEQVYLSTGESLAALISDEAVQEWFIQFVLVNVFVSSWQPLVCDDNSRLKVDQNQFHSQPFAAIGVARVGLGMERFREYLAEGLANANVKQLLWPHFEPVNPTDPKTPSQLIALEVEYNWGNFLQNSGLNERGEADDVLNALTPVDSKERSQAFVQKAMNFAQQGVEPAGLSNEQWVERLTNFFKLNQKTYEAEERNAICEQAKSWAVSIQEQVLRVTSTVTSRSGLNVAADLISKLRQEVIFVAKQELPTDAAKEIRKIDQLASKLRESLPQGMAKIQIEAMRQSVQPKLSKATEFISESLRMNIAAEIMADFEENFLKEFEQTIRNTAEKLQIVATDDKDENGEENRFPTFADIPTKVIPPQFKASVVEQLLIDPATYPEELENLVKISVSDSAQNWWKRIVERSLLGTLLDSRGDNEMPTLFYVDASWVPNNEAYRKDGGSQRAQFTLLDNPEKYVLRNRDWLMDTTTALGKFLVQDLPEYLNHPTASVQSQRRSDFRNKFETALNISAPLCAINQSLLGQLHPVVTQRDPRLLQISTIPFVDQGELKPLFDLTAGVIQAKNLWSTKLQSSFKLAGGVQSIDFFSCTTTALNPMVFTSLMDGIGQSWSKNNINQSVASGFWTNRRARPLSEALPIAPQKVLEMVRGWFLAGMLDQRKIASTPQQGPKVSIWSPDSRGFLDFVHPMFPMHNQTLVQNPEFLPAVLKSISLAMVHCHTKGNLDPLRPYWRLMDLGGNYQQILDDWTRSGKVEDGAPVPNPKLVGESTNTFENRKEIILTGLERTKQDLQKRFLEEEKNINLFRLTRIYEIKDYVVTALDDLLEIVANLEDAEGTVY